MRSPLTYTPSPLFFFVFRVYALILLHTPSLPKMQMDSRTMIISEPLSNEKQWMRYGRLRCVDSVCCFKFCSRTCWFLEIISNWPLRPHLYVLTGTRGPTITTTWSPRPYNLVGTLTTSVGAIVVRVCWLIWTVPMSRAAFWLSVICAAVGGVVVS